MHTLCPDCPAGGLLAGLGLVLLTGVAILAGVEFREAAGAALGVLVQDDPAPAMLWLAVSGMLAVNLWFAWHVTDVYTALRHGGQDA